MLNTDKSTKICGNHTFYTIYFLRNWKRNLTQSKASWFGMLNFQYLENSVNENDWDIYVTSLKKKEWTREEKPYLCWGSHFLFLRYWGKKHKNVIDRNIIHSNSILIEISTICKELHDNNAACCGRSSKYQF